MINHHQQTIEIIKSLVGQANILTIPRVLIDFCGNLETALVLSQMIYWTGKSDGWFFKTYDEWQSETTLSKHKVMKAVKSLKALGLLETCVKKARGNPTVHYFLKMDIFYDRLLKFLTNESSKIQQTNVENFNEPTITKTTTETTTENIYPPYIPPRGETNQHPKRKKSISNTELQDYLEQTIPKELEPYREKLLEFFEYRQNTPGIERYRTQKGIDGLFRECKKCLTIYANLNECLDVTMERGWRTPDPEYLRGRVKEKPKGVPESLTLEKIEAMKAVRGRVDGFI